MCTECTYVYIRYNTLLSNISLHVHYTVTNIICFNVINVNKNENELVNCFITTRSVSLKDENHVNVDSGGLALELR
jgi:hypothetical protein